MTETAQELVAALFAFAPTGRTRCSTGNSAKARRTRCWRSSCCRRCGRSAIAGSAATRRSRRSTSRATSCAPRCSASLPGGTWVEDGARCLACAPGELHDLPLIAFGVALHRRGWRILFLGTDTPLEMVASAANALGPDLVVVSSSVERDVSAEELAPLAAGRRLLLGGAWPLLDALEAERVGGDPVAAAAAVSG